MKPIVTIAIALTFIQPLAARSGVPPQTVNTRIGELNYEAGYPTKATSEKLYDEMDFQRATQGYMWAFPLVSSASIRRGLFNDLGASNYDIVVYQKFLDTKSIWLTGNNTTIYGAALFDMATDGPVIVELPAASSAGMLNDYWFITFGVGQLGPDKSKGGKYFIVPPGYKGDIPKEDYFIVHAAMNDYMFFLRGYVEHGDLAPAVELFHKVRIYPYSQRSDPKPNRVLEVTGKYVNTDEPEGLEYWKLLSEVLNNNPVDERDRFFMAMLKPLGIEKGKPFNPDDRQKRILEEGALLGHAMSQNTSFNPRIEGATAYPGTQWKNVFTMTTAQGHEQEAEYYTQLDERLQYLYLGTWPAEAMNLPFPSEGQRYLESFKDRDGQWLVGSSTYRLHVPPKVPAKRFWSVTVYDNLTRSMTVNKENRAAVTSYDKLKFNSDGSVDLHFGPKAPQGMENNWVDTSASKGWFVWFRFYAPTEPFFDKSWRLPDFDKVN